VAKVSACALNTGI